MARADHALEIVYSIDMPQLAFIRTTMTREGVEELLEIWIRSEVTKEKDTREPNPEADGVYHIWIGIQMSDDTIIMKSDTGNRSLDLGIIAGDIFPRLAEIELRPFVSEEEIA